GAGHEPFAVRAEGGPRNRSPPRFADVKIAGQRPRRSVPDLDAPPPPVPGCQPAAIRAEGGVSQTVALDVELPAGVLQIIEEGVAAIRAVGDGSTVGTQSELGVMPAEGSPGRQAEGL